jgi:hypothetical protein
MYNTFYYEYIKTYIMIYMFNKTIYMTYKNNIPQFVLDRWTQLNTDYEINFSLDDDCINFLQEHFNDYIVNLFKTIPIGMYKADLWRLCILYVYGGVYADVDLVPYLNIDELDKNITFYSCMNIHNNSIFQAFIINFSKPKNNLMFIFLLSFLLNNPYNYHLGPTIDMYNCIKYNLNMINVESEKTYNINEVKVNVIIGSSIINNKNINLHYFPEDIEYIIILKENTHNDTFEFLIKNNILNVKRVDIDGGWEHNHSIDIVIKSIENIHLFKEECGENNNWVTSYVTHNSNKILDSRDMTYYNNKGW